ncbi:cold shock domain-containing protein [Candidatus Parcubacteria bacterium]|nr:cold shock domain-containing protein [Candidatus Parcubacteria bacterium]
METGYVKFFDTREGKLFGFLVDDNGVELFFHYSGGCTVAIDGNQELTFEQAPPRYPKKGDYLKFRRGRNAKGPMAKAWCFQDEYERMDEKRKRDLTIDEAKQYLTDTPCDILEHTYSTTQHGRVITTVTTKVTWLTSSGHIAGSGEFVVQTSRWDSGVEDAFKTSNKVSINAPSSKFTYQTVFIGEKATAFKELGRPQRVLRGKKQGILWAGGWEEYVVDANSVRDMTRDELEKLDKSAFPTFEDGKWLRCLFAKNLGNEAQAVHVLAHLGGGE